MIDSTRLIDTSRIAASKNTPQNKTKKNTLLYQMHQNTVLHFHPQGPLYVQVT